MALQMRCSAMICDGCEHLNIAWPGMVPVTQDLQFKVWDLDLLLKKLYIQVCLLAALPL